MFFYQLETRHANGDLMLRDALPSPRQFSYEIRIVLTVRCFEQPEIHSEKQLFRQKKKKKKKRHLHLVLRCTLLSVACGCVECVASRRFSSIGHLASYWWNQSILSPLSGHVTWVTRCSVQISRLPMMLRVRFNSQSAVPVQEICFGVLFLTVIIDRKGGLIGGQF